jgi:GNAT superfamily N-acetyltransferase
MSALQNHFSIRNPTAREWPAYRDLRLRSLADSPDAFGSTLAEEQARAPEAWAARLSAALASGQDCPFIAEVAGTPAGSLWAKADFVDASVVNLFQMWVAPEFRDRGIAAALLGQAIAWAASRNARIVQLGVTCGDTPAMRLYLRAGFQPVGRPEPLRAGSPLLSQPMRLTLAQDAGRQGRPRTV